MLSCFAAWLNSEGLDTVLFVMVSDCLIFVVGSRFDWLGLCCRFSFLWGLVLWGVLRLLSCFYLYRFCTFWGCV